MPDVATWLTAHGLELTAVIFGIVSFLLSVRENVWAWPTVLVNVALSFALFYKSGLYSDMGLQAVYFVLSVYGWYEWLHGGAGGTKLRVSRARPRVYAILLAIIVVASAALGRLTSNLPGVALPYLDALLAITSLAAQWMMTRKLLENWIVWILLDVAYVGMYLFKGLNLIAVNYAVYLVVAIMGYIAWKRSLEIAPA
jgi:nicotinamide mononucleotide transporter